MSIKSAFETGEDDETIGTASERPRWKRIASTMAGGGLVLFGVRNRSLSGAIAALAGGWLVYRGMRGQKQRDAEYDTETGSDSPIGVDSDAIVDRFRSEFDSETPRIERSITIGESPEELYQLWLEPETVERLVGPGGEIAAVDEDDGRWRWTVSGPLKRTLTWETEIVEERPDEYLRWESLEGETVSSEGSIEFRPAPADRGTEVTLRLEFDPPGGAVGNAVTNRLGIVPKTLASKLLNRFKSLAETGEVPSLETNPSGRGKGDLV